MKKEEVIKIFLNLGFEVENNEKFGKLVKMSTEDAYIFSAIVGSPYLLYKNGITMKGRSEVFIHRSVFSKGYYIYSPGIFGRDKLGKLILENSADVLMEKYPSIFEGEKYIYIEDIPVNKRSNVEEKVYNLILAKGNDPKNFILFKNFLSEASVEPFYEYLACIHFIKRGYLVENQVPWFQQNLQYKGKVFQGGIPDFSAFHSSISSYLYRLGIINDKGLSISLLPVFKHFRNMKKTKSSLKDFEYELIIGEVKSSRSSLPSAVKQLKKYASVELANELYSIIPDVKNNGVKNFGEMFMENNELYIKKAKIHNNINSMNQKEDNGWIDNYIKISLLGNLGLESINKFIERYREGTNQELIESYEAIHLIDAILGVDNDNFFNFLIDNI